MKTKNDYLDEYFKKTSAEFRYNPDKDPVAQSQKKLYMQEADRQTADTLGKVSAQTGGSPSSYAVSAAAQAGNYQKSLWANQLSSLENIAYERNRQSAKDSLDAYNILFNEQKYKDDRDDLAYTRAQNAAQDREASAYKRWQAMGAADASTASALGVPVGTLYGGNISSASSKSSNTSYTNGDISAAYLKLQNKGADALSAKEWDALESAGIDISQYLDYKPAASDIAVKNAARKFEENGNEIDDSFTEAEIRALQQAGLIDSDFAAVDQEAKKKALDRAFTDVNTNEYTTGRSPRASMENLKTALNALEGYDGYLTASEKKAYEKKAKDLVNSDYVWSDILANAYALAHDNRNPDAAAAWIAPYADYLTEEHAKKINELLDAEGYIDGLYYTAIAKKSN